MRIQLHHHKSRKINTTRRDLIRQRWNVIQHELLPELRNDVGALTPKLEKVIPTLEWVRIEEAFKRLKHRLGLDYISGLPGTPLAKTSAPRPFVTI
jgi:hypothetical protein